MRTILHNDSLHDPQLKQSVRAIAETVVTPPECCGDLQLSFKVHQELVFDLTPILLV
jgi:hypothetical protein